MMLDRLKATPDAGDIELTLAGARVRISAGPWAGPEGSQQRMLSAAIEEPHLKDGFTALASAVGLASDGLPPLPEWLATAGRIELRELFAALDGDPARPEVGLVGVHLALDGQWTLITHFLEVSELGLFLAAIAPEDANLREFELSVRGTLDFAGAKIAIAATTHIGPAPPVDCSAAAFIGDLGLETGADAEALLDLGNWPDAATTPVDFAIEGQLLAPVSFADALCHFGWSAGELFGDLEVRALSMRYETAQGSYGFLIDIGQPDGRGGELPVLDGVFHLDGFYLTVEGAAGDSITGLLCCETSFAATRWALQAECNLADGGWCFSGEVEIATAADFWRDVETSFRLQLPAVVKGIGHVTAALSFDTASHDLSLSVHGVLSLAGTPAQIRLDIDLAPDGQGWSKQFTGALDLGAGDEVMRFELGIVDSPTAGSTLVATYQDDATQQHDLAVLAVRLAHLPPAQLPVGLSLTLPGAVFAHHAGGPSLLAVDLESSFDLGRVRATAPPFIARMTAGLDAKLAFQVVLCDADLPEAHALRQAVAAQGFALRSGPIKTPITLGARLDLGSDSHHLTLPTGAADAAFPKAVQDAAAAPATTAANAPSAHWIEVHRQLGPLVLDRIGVDFAGRAQGAEVGMLLDGGFEFAGLRVSLDGLAVHSPLSHFEPRFSLDGLGIDYRNPTVEIGGALLALGGDAGFAGSVVVRVPQMSLSAMGAFAEVDHEPTLFVYAALDRPLGGPPFFFVTGLAAGFGYNRDIAMPAAEQVADFPLVKWARPDGGGKSPSDPLAAIAELGRQLPIARGSAFAAIGVAFTTFKVVDSFALLVARFGARFELDLLGTSTLCSPPAGTTPGQPPVARATLGLRARFVPEDGILSVRAVLGPDSYVLSQDCHLGGGFAFAAWFRGQPGIPAGDFVITLGGYHEDFKVPAHYPSVPRLGLQWRVSPNLTIKGSAYYALTAGALMAGGRFDAVWKSGDVSAAFLAAADFLLTWKPYHYDVHVRVSISAQVTIHFFGTHHLSFDAGADVHLWGPAFSGQAQVHLKVLGFNVSFDVRFGAGVSRPVPIDWHTFRDSFLPPRPCAITARGGMLATLTDAAGETWWVVAPRTLVLAFESAVPLVGLPAFGTAKAVAADVQPAIAPMAVVVGAVDSRLTLSLTRNGRGSDDLQLEPIYKAMPAALWGSPKTAVVGGRTYLEAARPNDRRLVDRMLVGFTLSPVHGLDGGTPPPPRQPGGAARAAGLDPAPGPLATNAGESPTRRRDAMLQAMMGLAA